MKAIKLVIATPIFPPESGGPGTYTCAIAEKLYPKYECVIITYSDAPSPLAHTRVIAIRKSQNLLFRWCKYTVALFRELRTADIVYAQNAVASGFPAVIAGMLLSVGWISHPQVVGFSPRVPLDEHVVNRIVGVLELRQ